MANTIRLWPGIVGASVIAIGRFLLPVVAPGNGGISILAGVAGALIVLLWWIFFSRAPWRERGLAIIFIAAAIVATRPILHPSVTGGMMGMMFYIYAIPTACLALVIWAAVTRESSATRRLVTLGAMIVAACAVWGLVRTGGLSGAGESEFHWRWTLTPEERLLALETGVPRTVAPQTPASIPPPPTTAETPQQPAAPARDPAVSSPIVDSPRGAVTPEWPGFRGASRSGVVHGTTIETAWSSTPPVEMWRRAVGPGWSSFAVSGDFFYTQEQRGDDEIVACYRVNTGEPVWMHRDAVRFWESNGGAGPRGTPTLSNGRVYSLGATGIVNALDAATGAKLWSRNAATDTGAELPDWGFSASPLVVNGVVVVAASGALAAYDAGTGKPRWTGKPRGGSYSSPHLLTMDGAPQVMMLTTAGAIGVDPADGRQLWEYAWRGGMTIVQPAVASNGDVLFSAADAMGAAEIRRVAIVRSGSDWKVEERWTSNQLKPYFNDYVIHREHAYGFDGRILASIDLADGSRKWKGGRYGYGQLILLADQNLLLVLSEDGEIALVKAEPDQFTEVARVPAIEGKTWNHPVLAGSTLLVRNGEQMAAFRVSTPRR